MADENTAMGLYHSILFDSVVGCIRLQGRVIAGLFLALGRIKTHREGEKMNILSIFPDGCAFGGSRQAWMGNLVKKRGVRHTLPNASAFIFFCYSYCFTTCFDTALPSAPVADTM